MFLLSHWVSIPERLSQGLGLNLIILYLTFKPEPWLSPFGNTGPDFQLCGFHGYQGQLCFYLSKFSEVRFYRVSLMSKCPTNFALFNADILI